MTELEIMELQFELLKEGILRREAEIEVSKLKMVDLQKQYAQKQKEIEISDGTTDDSKSI